MLLATAPSSSGGSAAGLRYEGVGLLERLLGQLQQQGVVEAHVVTRPAWAVEFEPLLRTAGCDVRLRCSDDRSDDLRAIAAIARDSGGGALVVANADILTQAEALAGLLADPRVATGILATTRSVSRVHAFRTRARRGIVLAASTAYHVIGRPNGTFLGVLKLSAGDRATAADVAARLAEMLDGPPPEAWRDEFKAKAARWSLTLYRHGTGGNNAYAGDGAPEHMVDDDAVEDGTPIGEVDLAPEEEEELRRRLAAAEQDVTALLLFGLVRSAVRVSTSHLRQLFWARPLSPDDVDRAAASIGDHDEEEALLESAVKANDGFFTTFFVSPYSKYIARWAARRGWTPNGVTALSVLVGFLAAAAFATGERAGLVAGALLLQVAFTLDCVDGQLARYTRTFTAFGAWLDSIFDRTKEYAVFAGLAIGAAGSGDDVWLLAAAALTLQTVRHMMDFSFNIAQDQAMVQATPRPLEDRPRAPAADTFGPSQPEEAPDSATDRREARGKLERFPGRLWMRKIVAFPIGERFAAISLSAALFDARVTFIALLSLGGLAAVYTGGGRVLRSFGRRGPVTLSLRADPDPGHEAARDDGWLAGALGRLIGRRLVIPPIVVVTAGAVPLLAVALISGDDAAWWVASAAVAWAVLTGAVSGGRPMRDRLRWAVIPALRVVEYVGVIWLAVLAGAAAVPAAFALLCAITFRHYDAFYRTRQRGDAPPRWISLAAGGWDGRLVVVLILTAAGGAPAGLYVGAVALGAMLVAESSASWITYVRSEERSPLPDEEEDAE